MPEPVTREVFRIEGGRALSGSVAISGAKNAALKMLAAATLTGERCRFTNVPEIEDVFAMDVDGSNVVTIAGDRAGSEFDAAWSPDGEWVVYRDSTRGINNDDEVFIARADGSERRNLTDDPANDWGPDWSADGSTIVFNSDRDGGRLRGYLVHPDGTNLRMIDVDAWVEYASFSPDGKRIAFTGAVGNDYELYVADLESGAVEQLTDSPGHDSWPAWSPSPRRSTPSSCASTAACGSPACSAARSTSAPPSPGRSSTACASGSATWSCRR